MIYKIHVQRILLRLMKNRRHLFLFLLQRKKTTAWLMLMFCSLSAPQLYAQAQTMITLQMCRENADTLYPLFQQKEKLAQVNELELQNLKAQYLPELNLNASFSYQSKVVEVPLSMPGIEAPTMPKDQYAATIDINQLIYDGGATKAAKAAAGKKVAAELQEVEVELYKLKEQIDAVYFISLALQENEKVLRLTQESIVERKKVLEAAVRNGVVNASESDHLDAELLTLDQQLISLQTQKKQTLHTLAQLSCMELAQDVELALPAPMVSASETAFRPEHQLFLDQAAVLDASMALQQAKRYPKLAAYGSAGIGYPGLNFFSGETEPYFVVGAKLKWNIWDWSQTKRSKEQIDIQKHLLQDQEAVFNKQLAIQQSDAELKQNELEQLIAKDKEIIALRERIAQRSAKQLESGTATSADYIQNLNAEKAARIQLSTHKIQLAHAKISLITLSGNNIFNE